MFISRLPAFCLLLATTFSVNAQYNEAMCILLKQQINDYSQSNPNYRRAVRNYDKNCKNPQPVKSSSTNTKSVKAIENENDHKVITTQRNKESSVIAAPETSSQSEADLKTTQTKASELLKPAVEQSENKNTEELPKNTAPLMVPPINKEQPQQLPKTKQPAEQQAAEKKPDEPKKVASTNGKQEAISMISYIAPILLLLLIVLIIMRARNKRYNEKGEDNADKEHKLPEQKAATTKPVEPAISSLELEAEKSANNDFLANYIELGSTTNDRRNEFVENEIDYPIFEPQPMAAKEHQFKEPQVRDYNPNINDLGNNPLNHQTKSAASDSVTKNKGAANNSSAQISHSEIANGELPQNNPTKPLTNNEKGKNLFANLSLDPSWDPENDQQPLIIEPKTEPKSQTLLKAQERALKLKVDKD